LAVSKAPMVWSHSSVNPAGIANWRMTGWRARQLGAEDAKAIAAAGGVVGLWALGADVGQSPESYADRVAELAEALGWDHIAFGSDMNALASPALTNFADLRRVVTLLEGRKLPEARIRKLAIENYVRVLRLAFQAREA
ncbi:MAG: membrane dipeptidase, partial [Hyphomicrobiaceae bacterium]